MQEYIIWILTFFLGYKGYYRLRDFFFPKEYQVMKGGEPFFYKTKGKKAVLLVHGFTSTPQELKGLGKYLKDKGITCFAPLLPGHGTHPDELLKTNWKEWKECVIKSYKKLKKDYKEVYIIGSSLGGNLAFLTAKELKPKGIVTLGTPVIFRKSAIVKFMYYLGFIKRYQKKFYSKKDRKIALKKIHYKVLPLKKLGDVFKITKLTKKELPNINVPTLIMQSSSDYQIDEKNAMYMYKNIKTRNKELVMIPDSYHVFIMDKNKHIAFKKIYNFLKKN